MKLEQVKKNQARRLARKKSLRGELEVYEGDETGVSEVWHEKYESMFMNVETTLWRLWSDWTHE